MSKIVISIVYADGLAQIYRGCNTEDKIHGLVQDCSNSSALAMELLQSCTEPSRWSWNCLILIMGIKILIQEHVYIEKAPNH